MITSIIPKLPFVNKQETIDFYVGQLGFLMMADYGEYFIVNVGSVELHLFSYENLDPRKSDFMVYVRIDKDIEAFYEKLKMTDVTIHPNGKLEEKPWGQTEFSILDPSGTLLTFGQTKN
jgi:hypothetical protein